MTTVQQYLIERGCRADMVGTSSQWYHTHCHPRTIIPVPTANHPVWQPLDARIWVRCSTKDTHRTARVEGLRQTAHDAATRTHASNACLPVFPRERMPNERQITLPQLPKKTSSNQGTNRAETLDVPPKQDLGTNHQQRLHRLSCWRDIAEDALLGA